jgi:hypothetical protein
MNKSTYESAKDIVANYRKCDGCHNILKKEDTKDTWEYGYHKHWCKTCYEKIKDD